MRSQTKPKLFSIRSLTKSGLQPEKEELVWKQHSDMMTAAAAAAWRRPKVSSQQRCQICAPRPVLYYILYIQICTRHRYPSGCHVHVWARPLQGVKAQSKGQVAAADPPVPPDPS